MKSIGLNPRNLRNRCRETIKDGLMIEAMIPEPFENQKVYLFHY